MSCIYYYNGKQFNSEIELDDFLIENNKTKSILGDSVFSSETPQNHTKIVLKGMKDRSDALKSKMDEWRRTHGVEYDEEGEISHKSSPPYIGVNRFLARQTQHDRDKRLFPEFILKNYWAERYEVWADEGLSDKEKTILIQHGLMSDGDSTIVKDPETLKKYSDIIEKLWKAQGEAGSAIHKVLLLYFTLQTEGPYKGRYAFELTSSELLNYIQSNLEEKEKGFLNDALIRQIIVAGENIRNKLQSQLGDGLIFYPEFAVSQHAIENDEDVILYGIIDLLVVDKDGKTHIVDYKTSTKTYAEFGGVKKSAYCYQLATYLRMLEKEGLNVFKSKLLLAPIQLVSFKYDSDTDVYKFDSIDNTLVYEDITTDITEKHYHNINKFLPETFKLELSAADVARKVLDTMILWFPKYKSRIAPEKALVIEELKEAKALKGKDGKWEYRMGKYLIEGKSEADLVDKVYKFKHEASKHRVRLTLQVKEALSYGMKNNTSDIMLPNPTYNREGEIPTWLRDTLKKYCYNSWEIVDDDVLENYGVILVRNRYTDQIDVVRVSTNNLTSNYRYTYNKDEKERKRLSIFNTFIDDVDEVVKTKSLAVEGTYGNIECVETMVLLNAIKNLPGKYIGNIQVVNPYSATGIQMSNEELLYTINWLDHYSKRDYSKGLDENKFNTGEIHLLDKYELVAQQVKDILDTGEDNGWRGEYQHYQELKSAMSEIDMMITDPSEKIKKLESLLSQLKNGFYFKELLNTSTLQSDLNRKHILLYNSIVLAIALLKGINFRQQLLDHDQWLELTNISSGVTGNYIDNPGNLSSETLNLLTKLVTEAYQNTRDDILREDVVIKEFVENLKKDKGFSYMQEISLGNQVSNLYKDMYRVVEIDGKLDLWFVNPKTLGNEAARKFLEYALYKINKNRLNKSDAELERMKNNDDPEYYRVPLSYGGQDSIYSSGGLLEMFKEKCKSWMPNHAWERARLKVEGMFEEDEDARNRRKSASQIQFEMVNTFDQGEGENRLRIIEKNGIDKFEKNLETLLLRHLFAYSVKDNMDSVFPLIRACVIHLSQQGAMQNTVFESDMKYAREYIENKIFNKSIVGKTFEKFAKYSGVLKHASSLFTLAMSPIQLFYQPLLGLWNDIKLFISKPDGTDAFTFTNLKNALGLVYKDLFHVGNKPTIMQLLNQTYGINDMDMNDYVNRISTGRKGLWNIEQFLFKFASRPDYYNRLTIIGAKMLSEGTYKAHSIKNGRLHYDFYADERFSAFAHNKTSDPKYKEQRSLYYAMAKLFVNEHAKNKDGTPFEFNMDGNIKPLPRAYTNLEAESIKSLCDNIYGYYSHEKKSMIMATALGSMWLLFKTFWSGKKNLYLGTGGIKLQGKWKQYTENGEKYYYEVDESGNVLYNKPPLRESEIADKDKIAPVMLWEGQWQEGILVTLSNFLKYAWNNHKLTAWKDFLNEQNPRIRQVQVSNMKQFGYDMFMWIIMGTIVAGLMKDGLKDLLEDNKKNRDLLTGLELAAANVAVRSVTNSFLDFNIIDSLGGPIMQWSPFAFEWGGLKLSMLLKVATGDEDIQDALVKSFGATNFLKPAFDAIKPDIFRTPKEGGTFNKKD